MGYDKPKQDDVGEPDSRDDGRQSPAQKAILGGGGEVGGRPEPKSGPDWEERGAAGGVPGRPPVAVGGSSAGQSDRMPAGGASVSNARATNPKSEPGHTHES